MHSPAFPASSQSTPEHQLGLSKREYFAAAAMNGILSVDASKDAAKSKTYAEDVATASLIMADTLIRLLAK